MARDINGGGPIIGEDNPGGATGSAPASSNKTIVYVAVGAGVLLVVAALIWLFVK